VKKWGEKGKKSGEGRRKVARKGKKLEMGEWRGEEKGREEREGRIE